MLCEQRKGRSPTQLKGKDFWAKTAPPLESSDEGMK